MPLIPRFNPQILQARHGDHACNLNTQEIRVQGRPGLYNGFETSLEYVRTYQKGKKGEGLKKRGKGRGIAMYVTVATLKRAKGMNK